MNNHRQHREQSPAPSEASPHLTSASLPGSHSVTASYDETSASNPPLNVPSIPRTTKPTLSALSPSLASPSRNQRSVTLPVPPSPSKSIRPLPPAKSGTDSLVPGEPEKGRSFSVGFDDGGGGEEKEKVGRSRETTRALLSEGLEKGASRQKREKVYLEKLKLYETKTKLYIVGCDDNETRFRVLKIDRTAPPPRPNQTVAEEVTPSASDEEGAESGGLTITEDPMVYTRMQKDELVETLKAGNGGAIKVAPDVRRYRDDGWHPYFYGIVGFVRLSSSYRLVLVTHRHKCALLGGSYIYQSESTLLYPITPASMTTYAAEDHRQEQAFGSVYLTQNFYFSYAYDLTHTLQSNLLRGSSPLPPQDKFAWNWHLLTPLRRALKAESPWVLPLVHGVVDQMKINVFARPVYITLIGRRSRHFAGARYLRRGVNEQGWVANDVESEQIVSEEVLTPFHVPTPSLLSSASQTSHPKRSISPRYTSHTQMRGSIPFFWGQDTSKGIVKPEIKMVRSDPFYSAAAKHFDQLFEAYGGRVVAMNLIKQSDHRESNLIPHFRDCIKYLNQFLPDENKIDYIEYDMSRAKRKERSTSGAVIHAHAEAILKKTGFFHSGAEVPRRPTTALAAEHGDDEEDEAGGKEEKGRLEAREGPMVQRGVIRTNCIGTFRTNSAQGLIAEVVLAHQLYALGFLPAPQLPPESDAIRLLEFMWNEHGDTLALQYSGSGAIHGVADYKPEKEDDLTWVFWRSGSREKIEALKRLYANSFSDADKQAAIDLYLGISPPLPPPPSFEYLPPPPRRSYQNWFTPSHLSSLDISSSSIASLLQATVDTHLAPLDGEDQDREKERDRQRREGGPEWWKRYYRTNNWTTLEKTWTYRMDGTLKALTEKTKFPMDDSLLSPFISRRALAAPRPRHKSGLRSWIHPTAKSARQSRHVSAAHPNGVDDSSASVTSSTHPTPAPLPTAPFSAPTSQLAAAHLSPVLRATEVKEYDAWTTQFRHLYLAPTTDHLSEKDRSLYSQHAGVSLSELNERDRQLYIATAVAGRPAKGYKADGGVAPGAVKVYREMVEGVGSAI
ncbi:hypothetical protein JCM11251_004264 [Rhodosporidiobolus azoricus]